MIRCRTLGLSVLLLSLASAVATPGAAASTRYDHRLRFRTIATPRFDIHFHQGVEDVARRLAAMIEEAAREVDAAVGAPSGRVQVILVDQHDLSNGWASPLPYNTIEISTAAPVAESSIGNSTDWLRLVFVHEYTHVAHLSRARGWIGGLRRGFGRLPLLFPNLYQPLWAIEGIATWEESRATGRGRVQAGDFRLLLDRAASAGRFEPIDRTNGGNVDWPSGATPYLYGAYFHQYLADTYGQDSIRRLADETSGTLPYFGARGFKKVYGRSLGELWREFEAVAAKRAAPPGEVRASRLTSHGFNVAGPRFGADGRVFYSAASPHHFPALMEVPGVGGTPRKVSSRFLGTSIGIAGGRLVVDEVDLVRNVGLQSDLYVVDPRDGDRRRLTREARASYPDVAPDGRTVVCTVQMADRRALATLQLPAADVEVAPRVLIDEAATNFASPRWSPDGRWIAAERQRLGHAAEVVLIDPAARSVRPLARVAGGRAGAPTWTKDGARVLFSAAAGGDPFRIYAVDVASGSITRLEGTGASAQSPELAPEGDRLIFVGYTDSGYDLFSMSMQDASWTPVAAGAGLPRDDAVAANQTLPQDVGPRGYSPWPTLAPRFWTPTVETDSDELVIGAATGSVDALGRHAYGIEAGWSVRARPDWQAAYAYDRWKPTFFTAIADDTDPWRGGELRTREFDAGLLLPISRVRFAHTTFASLHVSQDDFTCSSCGPAEVESSRRTAVRLGWEFTNARGFGYSIGAEEGGRLTVTAEPSRLALGSQGSSVAWTIDARRYWRVTPRHAVVALRAAAAGSSGDADAQRLFSAAGHGPQPGGFGFGVDAIGLLRGFDEADVAGTRAVVLNVDYRLPLMRIDRGAGTIPLFVRTLHGALFVDGGHAWTGAARWSEMRMAIGAELSVDAVVGFALPLTFTTGGAWRRDGGSGERGFVAFGRIGRAF